MESTSSNVVYRSLQSYWRRRAYQRLDGPSSSTKKKTVRLGGGSESRRRKRSWRLGALRKVLRIKVRIPSPKKLLLQLRDAYVNSMLALAGAMPAANKSSKKVEAVWGRRIPKAREVAVKSAAGELEMRMILHIYNTVMSQPREQLISCV